MSTVILWPLVEIAPGPRVFKLSLKDRRWALTAGPGRVWDRLHIDLSVGLVQVKTKTIFLQGEEEKVTNFVNDL